MVRLRLCLIIIFMVFAFVNVCSSLDNHLEGSKEEASKVGGGVLNYSTMENPFRVQKINLLWEKARFVACYPMHANDAIRSCL